MSDQTASNNFVFKFQNKLLSFLVPEFLHKICQVCRIDLACVRGDTARQVGEANKKASRKKPRGSISMRSDPLRCSERRLSHIGSKRLHTVIERGDLD